MVQNAGRARRRHFGSSRSRRPGRPGPRATTDRPPDTSPMDLSTICWRLGILTDSNGHVHLGAVVRGAGTAPAEYVDLIAPLAAGSPADLDLDHLVVLDPAEDLTNLRGLAETSIEDLRLRTGVVGLADLAARQMESNSWQA